MTDARPNVEFPARLLLADGVARVLRAPRPRRPPDDPLYSTSVDTLLPEGHIADVPLSEFAPTGPTTAASVLHVGRCGSTVLSRLLQMATGRWVVREAPFVNDLLVAMVNGETTADPDLWDRAGRSFGAVFGTGVVLKHSSWEALCFPTVAAMTAHPVVCLVREPTYVVRSMLDRHPAWLRHLLRSGPEGRLLPWSGLPADPPEAVTLFAHYWAAVVDAMLDLPPERVCWVSYESLRRNPVETVGRVAEFCRIGPSSLDAGRAQPVLETYAKPREGTAASQLEGRPGLQPRSSATVRRVTADVVQRLEERTRGSWD